MTLGSANAVELVVNLAGREPDDERLSNAERAD
jgi:hypothetical protein